MMSKEKNMSSAYVPKSLAIALVGGTGFIGQALSQELAAQGHTVRLVARHAPASLQPHESFASADAIHENEMTQALKGCQVVVHLVAILAERGQTFEQAIHQSAANVAAAAYNAGVEHVVLVSALGANLNSASRYARAKALAEIAVRKVFPQATILQPSLVLGFKSGFTRQIDNLTRFSPIMVLPGWGRSRFQPVDVKVLAKSLADACTQPEQRGKTIVAAGPHIQTFKQLVVAELTHLGRKRLLVPLPWPVTWASAYILQAIDKWTFYKLIPEWLLVTPDQVHLLKAENITPQNQKR